MTGPKLSPRGKSSNDDEYAADTSANKFTFSIEDTFDGSYRDIVLHLSLRSWVKRPFHTWTSGQHDRHNLFTGKPHLIWTLNARHEYFPELLAHQIYNHYEGLSTSVATKMGFCELLREMRWTHRNALEIAPRYEVLLWSFNSLDRLKFNY
jgi:hypothetical protein